jgi:rhamnosyltransferase
LISIIIPTLNAASCLPALVYQLRVQNTKEVEIIVVDSDSADGTASIAASLGCQVYAIPRREFDHGGTRNFAARMSSGEILVFLTQDVLPVGTEFLERLTAPIVSQLASASYARQIAGADAPPTEAFARSYNYPSKSSTRHIAEIRGRTLKTFFFSNAASAISREAFHQLGGFPAPVPTNEDMLFCAKLLDAGLWVSYVAEAEVIHSHDFSLIQTFQRYRRIGQVAREHQATLKTEGNSGDGLNFVRRQIRFLREIGRTELVPFAIVEAGVKALAFSCGRLSRSRSGVSAPRPVRSTPA